VTAGYLERELGSFLLFLCVFLLKITITESAPVTESSPVKDLTMHRLFERASGLTETIIGAAIEVHRDKGPGLMESIYEWCLIRELALRGLNCVSQKVVRVEYKGATRDEILRFDVLVEGCVLVEVKAMEKVTSIHKAQLLSYMKLLDVPVGLLINFHEMKLIDGVSRLVLHGAGKP